MLSLTLVKKFILKISFLSFVPFLAEENQRTHLDWVTIGQVKPQGIDDFIFTYSASENDLTLWDGKLPKIFLESHFWTSQDFTAKSQTTYKLHIYFTSIMNLNCNNVILTGENSLFLWHF